MTAGGSKKKDILPPEILQKVAARMIQIRKEQGYRNSEEFTNVKNINRTQYAKYERGHNLTMLSLDKVVKAFGMTIPEFFSQGFSDSE
jgi:transcriptional regulator with XRE-family HTH domain